MKKILLTIGLFSTVLFFAQKNENYFVVGYHSICCGTPSDKPKVNEQEISGIKKKVKLLSKTTNKIYKNLK